MIKLCKEDPSLRINNDFSYQNKMKNMTSFIMNLVYTINTNIENLLDYSYSDFLRKKLISILKYFFLKIGF